MRKALSIRLSSKCKKIYLYKEYPRPLTIKSLQLKYKNKSVSHIKYLVPRVSRIIQDIPIYKKISIHKWSPVPHIEEKMFCVRHTGKLLSIIAEMFIARIQLHEEITDLGTKRYFNIYCYDELYKPLIVCLKYFLDLTEKHSISIADFVYYGRTRGIYNHLKIKNKRYEKLLRDYGIGRKENYLRIKGLASKRINSLIKNEIKEYYELAHYRMRYMLPPHHVILLNRIDHEIMKSNPVIYKEANKLYKKPVLTIDNYLHGNVRSWCIGKVL